MQAAGTAAPRANGQSNPHNRAARNSPKLSDEEQRALDRAGERTHVVWDFYPALQAKAMVAFSLSERGGAALRLRPASAPVCSCCRLCMHHVLHVLSMLASVYVPENFCSWGGSQRGPLVSGSMGSGDAPHPQCGLSSWLRAEPSSRCSLFFEHGVPGGSALFAPTGDALLCLGTQSASLWPAWRGQEITSCVVAMILCRSMTLRNLGPQPQP